MSYQAFDAFADFVREEFPRYRGDLDAAYGKLLDEAYEGSEREVYAALFTTGRGSKARRAALLSRVAVTLAWPHKNVKCYEIECETPRDWREFKRIAAQRPQWYGRLHEAGNYWVAPADETRFRELLSACRGTALEM